MKNGKVLVLIFGLLGLLALPLQAAAGPKYTLKFERTETAPDEAQGTMTIKVERNGQTTIDFTVWGVYPNTLYTIWIAFYNPDVDRANQDRFPSDFPAEGSPVSPLARLDDAFTSGMGVDPGASFFTDGDGHGKVKVKLDYNILEGAPVSNRDIIYQCVPGPAELIEELVCPEDSKRVRVTTTWLRQYIGQTEDPEECANYPQDQDIDLLVSLGKDPRFWQCVDPATGLPRVVRRPDSEPFNHFRLANHLDGLTHGFIGGDKADHQIDMIGRFSELEEEEDTEDAVGGWLPPD